MILRTPINAKQQFHSGADFAADSHQRAASVSKSHENARVQAISKYRRHDAPILQRRQILDGVADMLNLAVKSFRFGGVAHGARRLVP